MSREEAGSAVAMADQIDMFAATNKETHRRGQAGAEAVAKDVEFQQTRTAQGARARPGGGNRRGARV